MIFFALLLLSAYAVWESTEKRLGTTDEVRTLLGVFAMILIYGGAAILLEGRLW